MKIKLVNTCKTLAKVPGSQVSPQSMLLIVTSTVVIINHLDYETLLATKSHL